LLALFFKRIPKNNPAEHMVNIINHDKITRAGLTQGGSCRGSATVWITGNVDAKISKKINEIETGLPFLIFTARISIIIFLHL